MDRGWDNGFYDGVQGGDMPSLANSHAFPLSSPSWYTPIPQLAPPNSFVCNQSHQTTSKNYDKTFNPSNAFGEFSSSSRGVVNHAEFGVPNNIPSFVMDQRLDVDNMMINYPSINFSNQVIKPSNQFPDSGSNTNTSRNYTKRLWTSEEDSKLNALVSQFGTKNWTLISDFMDGRAGKQCRERWYNNLRPDIKSDVWTEEEERILIEAHEKRGNKWSQIAKLLPGRTENAIKNHWNAATRKKTMRLNKNKKYEPDNTKPKSTLLRDYIRGMSSTSTGTAKKSTPSTTSSNATIAEFTLVPPDEPPSSFSCEPDPSIDLIPTYDEEFSFMLQALEPQLQTNMQLNTDYQTATQLSSDANISPCPVSEPATFSNSSEPVYAFGDMNMDLAFNGQGGDFSSL